MRGAPPGLGGVEVVQSFLCPLSSNRDSVWCLSVRWQPSQPRGFQSPSLPLQQRNNFWRKRVFLLPLCKLSNEGENSSVRGLHVQAYRGCSRVRVSGFPLTHVHVHGAGTEPCFQHLCAGPRLFAHCYCGSFQKAENGAHIYVGFFSPFCF